MRNHDFVPALSRVIAAGLVLLGSGLLAFAFA